MKKLSIILGIILTILTIIYYAHWLITPKVIKQTNYSDCNISKFELTASSIEPRNTPNLSIWGNLVSNCDVNMIGLMNELNYDLIAYSTSENNVYYLSPGQFIINPVGHFWKKGIGLGAAANNYLDGTYFDIYILLINKTNNLPITTNTLPKYHYLEHFQVKRPKT